MKSNKIAVILSGCGRYDGAEIHEATMTLYAIAKNGLEYDVYAPNIQQHHVVNHLTGEEMAETRHVMEESARIARGEVLDLAHLDMSQYDALIMPGGFGAAKNLSNYALVGAEKMTVIPDLEKALLETHRLHKPIGALCIAPIIVSKVIKNALLTVGQDENTINDIQLLGGKHQITQNGEVSIDTQNKIVTTPCYMLDANIVDIANGTDQLVKSLKELISEQ